MGHVRTVQKTQVIFDYDRIHWLRHLEAQTVAAIGRRYRIIKGRPLWSRL